MIKIFKTRNELLKYRSTIPGQSIGIIPTMGNLHLGHLSLVEKSIQENAVSVITIFVNPKQFGPNEDFDKYPRTLDEDLNKISNLSQEKEIIVFAPSSIEEIYPPHFNTVISVKDLTLNLEGKIRPHHFDGVTTVVFQLFQLVKANNAYFGQKDYQQCMVIKKMIEDLNLDIAMHILPIVRDLDGLALSSRNQYLNPEERQMALHLPQSLKKIENIILNNSEYKSFISDNLLDNRWDYLEVLDSKNLQPPSLSTNELVILGALKINKTRLLDNLLVKIL